MLFPLRRRGLFLTLTLFPALYVLLHLLFTLACSRPRLEVLKYTKRFSQRYAFATFLGPRAGEGPTVPTTETTLTLDADPYFTSIRLLTYQLLHAPKTRPRTGSPAIPFLVLTLPSVPEAQIATLAAEGATIIPIAPLDLPEIFRPQGHEHSRFRDVLAKLRVWQLTQYDRILCLDADTVVLEPLDGIFTDAELNSSMLLQSTEEDSAAVTQVTDLPPPIPST